MSESSIARPTRWLIARHVGAALEPTTPLSHRAADLFGVAGVATEAAVPASQVPLRAGVTVLLTGPSGGGKSTRLGRLVRRARRRGWKVVNVARVRLRDRPSVDQFETPRDEPDDAARLRRALGRLTRVGLGEASVFLARPSQMSDGQRWRLRLAVAMWRLSTCRRRVLLVADEFAAVLDRISAQAVAFALRREARALREAGAQLCVVVATAQDDLVEALAPDVGVWCEV